MDRPLTQREIKQRAKSKEAEEKITVSNVSKGTVIVQVREKSSDFYVGERSIYINPGKSYTDRQSLFNEAQLSNLQARGDVRVS
jgi:hypothetical protein